MLVSLLSSEEQTGIFGTSFRIFELLLGLPALILSVALPLLSVAVDEDDDRLRNGLQSMTEASLLIAALLVVGMAILAEPGIRLVGGEEYIGAAPVLRIQALALIPVFLGQVWQLGFDRRPCAARDGRRERSRPRAGDRARHAFVPRGGAKRRRGWRWSPRWRSPRSSESPSVGCGPGQRRPCGLRGSPGWRWRSRADSDTFCAIRPFSPHALRCGAFVVIAVATSAVPADAYHAFGLSRGRRGRMSDDRVSSSCAAITRTSANCGPGSCCSTGSTSRSSPPRERIRASMVSGCRRGRSRGRRRARLPRGRARHARRRTRSGMPTAMSSRSSGAPRLSTRRSSVRGSRLNLRACGVDSASASLSPSGRRSRFAPRSGPRARGPTAASCSPRRISSCPTTDRAARCLLLEGVAAWADPSRPTGDRRRALRLRADRAAQAGT